ncbi:rluC [Symbiodinium sp. CCMP2456]|nr:rluC [Symbiodinium sp. CCMP2456]
MSTLRICVDDMATKAAMNSLSQAGLWPEVLQMFSRLDSIDRISFSSCKTACAKSVSWAMPLALVDSALFLQVSLDIIDFSTAISACEKTGKWASSIALLGDAVRCKLQTDALCWEESMPSSWQLVLFLRSELDRICLPARISSCNRGITACQRGNQWQVARCLLHSLHDSLRRDVVSYNSAVGAFRISSQWQPALVTYEAMAEDAVVPDSASKRIVASSVGRCSSWPHALFLATRPEQSSIATDLHSITASLNWEKASASYDLMVQQGVSCSQLRCHSLVSSCATAALWREAASVYESAVVGTLQPDAEFCETLISGRTDQCWQLAVNCMSDRLKSGKSRTTFWYRYIQASASKVGWSALLIVLARFREAYGEPDLKINGMLCESFRQAGWRKVMALLRHVGSKQVTSDSFLYSSAMSSCRSQGKWLLAGALLDHCARTVQCDTVVWNTYIANKGLIWPAALNAVGSMISAGFEADVVSYNSMMATYSDHWQRAAACYEHMELLNLELDVAFPTAIDSCKHAGREEIGKRIVIGARHVSCILRFWAMAEMVMLTDLKSCFVEVLQQVNTQKMTTAEVSKLWWTAASLGLHHPTLLTHLEHNGARLLRQFTLEEMVAVAMGACTTDAATHFLCALRKEVRRRAAAIERQEGTGRQEVLQQFVGMLWALNFAVPISKRDFTSFRQFFNRLAIFLDEVSSPERQEARFAEQVQSWTAVSRSLKSPLVLLTPPDCVVTAKPAGWEVYGDTKLQMLPYVQTVLGKMPIHEDRDHAFGFLHRLDIPSSGLILSAATYAAFYDLQLQLVCGRLLRDYVVLCHGHVPHVRNEIQARLKLTDVAHAGAQGKASRTLVKMAARATGNAGASHSLVLVRILTGRLHQIRSHFAFFGHPTVSDSRYTSAATFGSDLASCPRNFVHRYHLAFEDRTSTGYQSFMPIPSDLCGCLKSLAACDELSSKRLKSWVLGRELNWEEFPPLGPRL